MANRFETRLKKLEARHGDDVDLILDGLTYEQGRALIALLMSALKGVEEPSDERREKVLASIPDGTAERLLAAYLKRVAWKEAA